MREVRHPFKAFGIRYFKDENGQYYKKVGQQPRKQIRPFWKLKRFKLGLPLVFILIVGFTGYQVAMDMASKKVVSELSNQIPEKEIQALLKNPDIQKEIENQIGEDKKQLILEKYSVSSTPIHNNETQTVVASSQNSQPAQPVNGSNSKTKFTSRDQVMKFLLSKFSMSELTTYMKKAQTGVTPEEKAKIKADVLKRLTPEEYDALKVFALIELSKEN